MPRSFLPLGLIWMPEGRTMPGRTRPQDAVLVMGHRRNTKGARSAVSASSSFARSSGNLTKAELRQGHIMLEVRITACWTLSQPSLSFSLFLVESADVYKSQLRAVGLGPHCNQG